MRSAGIRAHLSVRGSECASIANGSPTPSSGMAGTLASPTVNELTNPRPGDGRHTEPPSFDSRADCTPHTHRTLIVPAGDTGGAYAAPRTTGASSASARRRFRALASVSEWHARHGDRGSHRQTSCPSRKPTVIKRHDGGAVAIRRMVKRIREV
jgi:hypothetical protein